ncbi:hypothetical protein [Sorangium sp. So ce542]|uniref:hypothetical protein n=1 Tax=Sorangium sp. So ce542 TaxID=3133316 RepID=UPI003F5F159D
MVFVIMNCPFLIANPSRPGAPACSFLLMLHRIVSIVSIDEAHVFDESGRSRRGFTCIDAATWVQAGCQAT